MMWTGTNCSVQWCSWSPSNEGPKVEDSSVLTVIQFVKLLDFLSLCASYGKAQVFFDEGTLTTLAA